MRTILTMLLLIAAAFWAGTSYKADRIATTCESDDTPTVINGREYLCLSARHLQMMREQRQGSAWRGA